MAPDSNTLSDFLFHRTSNGVLIADADGIVKSVNPAAAAMLVVAADQMLGFPVTQCFANNPSLLALFTQTVEKDVRLPRRRLAVGTATTLPDGARIVLLQDVTEQRELDQRREALIASMAHDLRSPLAALFGYVDLIETMGELSPDQQYFVERTRDTAGKLNAVAAELIDLAWIEAGMPFKHAPVDLQQPIEQVIEELKPLAEEKQVTFFVSVQEPLPQIMGDADRIRQVVYKLLHNAIVYSNTEQIVAVHARSDGKEVVVSVADQGIGIPMDDLDLVFDRMFRSRDPRVQAVPGGGIGLTIARLILSRHGGTISVISSVDKGSTFTFRLPSISA